MSEVLNAKVIASEENHFSRRRVVKGVAWSVPVIMTTIAVPPASASTGSATVTILNPGTPITYSQGNRGGTGPTAIRITGVVGAISGSVIIAPVGAVRASIGIQPSSTSVFSASNFSGNTSTTTFAAGTGTGQALDIPVSFFNLEDTAGNNKPRPNDVYSYSMTVLLTGPNSGSVRAETSLTIRFK
ncbi:hypothetical protein [Arthrobacter sp. ZGTC412]|uniref:hypothetical protein n=1 Tax=Arthrobacter sp. ZGTC412 TaxID=2058900 RepID=UPI000CE2F85D|nr:hypothetical protein [Arthrobacter sp. ZGTC412]